MVSASVVIFRTNESQLKDLLSSIAANDSISKLYVIDNEPSDSNAEYFKNCCIKDRIEYIPHTNTGYGSSHNIALRKSIEEKFTYHLILNPDIYFGPEVMPELVNYMDQNPDAVYIIPKVLYPDGNIQYLCKLLPSPFHLVARRFFTKFKFTREKNKKYSLEYSGYDKIMNPPCLSGCFMFLRNSTVKEHDLYFDERYFMYFEDFDLIRRLHRVGRTVFYPYVHIFHNHMAASYKDMKMLKIHIRSAFIYFNNYGWFWDKERRQMNRRIIKEIDEML